MIRIATENDIPKLKEIWVESFSKHDSLESIEYYFNNEFDLDHTFILENDKEILCTLQLNQHTIMYDGIKQSVSFLVGVATPEKHQRKGYMRQLLDYAMDYAKNTLKQKIMILQAYNWDVYRSFGFKEMYYKSKFTLDYDFFSEFEIDEFNEGSDRLLLQIYQSYTKTLNGYSIRDEEYFKKMRAMNNVDNIKYAATKDAYITYYIENNIMYIPEVAFKTYYDIFCLVKSVMKSLSVNKVELFSDIFNYDYYKFDKELFMMGKILDDQFSIKDDRLYISEWI